MPCSTMDRLRVGGLLPASLPSPTMTEFDGGSYPVIEGIKSSKDT